MVMSGVACYCYFLCILVVNASLLSVLATYTNFPTWHYYNNVTEQCECEPMPVCSNGKIEIENGFCVTSSEKEGDYYVQLGTCPFMAKFNIVNRRFSEMLSNTRKLDEVMCGPYNRRGLLCGECKDGYGPAYSSFDLTCANCSSVWSGYTIYLLLQLVPSTLMFVSFVVCRFNIMSGPLLGYVLFCQISQRVVTYGHHFIYEYIQSHNSKTLREFISWSVALSKF